MKFQTPRPRPPSPSSIQVLTLGIQAGWLASRVEYVKPSGNEELRIALTHVGAVSQGP
jgi:hypothetical protein